MKKNFMMRAASVLLVAVMLTTCAISGTFAKYTTADDGSDTARVAKWGVTVDAGGTMFAEAYELDDTTLSADAAAIVGTNSVVVDEDYHEIDNLVAPGTEGEMAKFSLGGAPEVAVKVTYDATVTLSDWIIEVDGTEKFYCPLIFKVGATTIDSRTLTDAAAVKTALEEAIEGYSAVYAANTDLSTKTVDVPVTWEWDFDASGAGTYDKLDTLLGNKATTNPDTVEVKINVTVTQID